MNGGANANVNDNTLNGNANANANDNTANGNANENDNTANANANVNDNADNVNDNTDGSITDVSIQNIAFMPSSVMIPVGTTVRWTNNETANIPHTVTSGNPGDADSGSLFDDGMLPGESFMFTFEQVGTFTYFCEFHPTIMRDATVIVTEN